MQLVFLWVRLCRLTSICVSHAHDMADMKTLSSVTAWDVLAQAASQIQLHAIIFSF